MTLFMLSNVFVCVLCLFIRKQHTHSDAFINTNVQQMHRILKDADQGSKICKWKKCKYAKYLNYLFNCRSIFSQNSRKEKLINYCIRVIAVSLPHFFFLLCHQGPVFCRLTEENRGSFILLLIAWHKPGFFS